MAHAPELALLEIPMALRIGKMFFNHIESLNESFTSSLFWAETDGHLMTSTNVGLCYDWIPESCLLLSRSIPLPDIYN
jgi:hypothetical protein